MQTKEGVYLIEKKAVPKQPKPDRANRQKKPRDSPRPYSTLYDSNDIPLVKLFFGYGKVPHYKDDGNVTRVATLDVIVRGSVRFPELDPSFISTVWWLTNEGYEKVEKYLKSYPSGNIVETRYAIEIMNKYHIVLDKNRNVLTIDTTLDPDKVPKLIETPKIVDDVPTKKTVIKPEHTTSEVNKYLYKMLQATYRDFRKVFLPSP